MKSILTMEKLFLWFGLVQACMCLKIVPYSACYNNVGVSNITSEGIIGVQNYIEDMICKWNITAPEHNVVRLQLLSLDMESCPMQGCDQLIIHNSTLDKPLDGKMPEVNVYFSKGRHMVLEFTSDHTHQEKGFEANITFHKHPGVAFYAVKTGTYSIKPGNISLMERIYFDEVRVNVGEAFDLSRSVFTCPVTGVYYFAISTGTYYRENVEMVLRVNGRRYASIFRKLASSSKETDSDTLERGMLIKLEQAECVDVAIAVGEQGSSVHAEPSSGRLYVLGFLLPFAQEQDAALFAGTTRKTYNKEISIMDKKVVELGNWGNAEKKAYIPRSGIYMGHANVGASQESDIQITSPDSATITYNAPFYFPHFNTLSIANLFKLSKGSYLQVKSSWTDTNKDLLTSLTAFIISPDDASRPYIRLEHYTKIMHPDVVKFNDSTVIDYNWRRISYNGSTGKITCKEPGLYYFYVSIYSCYNYPSKVDIMHNEESLGLMTFKSVRTHKEKNAIPMKKSLLVHLDIGDALSLILREGSLNLSKDYHDKKGIILFGFMLYDAMS